MNVPALSLPGQTAFLSAQVLKPTRVGGKTSQKKREIKDNEAGI